MAESYTLSSTLEGHSLDVRSLSAVEDSIYSVSRDATGRVWNRGSNGEWLSSVIFQSPTSAFVNAVSANDLWTAFGGKDCIIYLNETHGDAKSEGFELPGHSSNVCSLSFLPDLTRLISGSWDATARVWDLDLFSSIYTLKGHMASVWDAKIIDEDTFLTASADRTIRLWQSSTEVRQFLGHTDVVRKLLLFPDDPTRFASCSNDGTIKIWDIDSGKCLQTLEGHESFVYDLGLAPTGDIISTGEDRSVRLWRDGICVQAIRLPCVSVWCVTVLQNGDIAVGGSDSTIRVFTLDPERVASKDILEVFAESVKASAISEQGLDGLKHTDLPGPEALEKAGKQEGETIMVKTPAGTIEAHQWSGGVWMKIGDVVGAAGNGDSTKTEFNGQTYDYVFDVDIEDGAPPLKLPFNVTDNVYTVADKFLADNDLPSSYTEEIVRFIMKNTEGVTLGEAPDSTNANDTEPPTAASDSKIPSEKSEPISLSVIPVKDYIFFKDYNPEHIVKGLKKFNAEQESSKQLDGIEMEEIFLLIRDLTSKAAIELIESRLPKLFKTWSVAAQLVLYDILRICVPRVSMAEMLNSPTAVEFVFEVVTKETSNVSVLMMITKVLSNIVGNLILFVQLFVDVAGYENTFKRILSIIMTNGAKSKEHKHFSALMTNVSTFLYNVSVFQTTSKNAPSSSKELLDIINEYGDDICHSNSEAAYRLTVALGNVLYFDSSSMSVGPPWLMFTGDTYKEKRFLIIAKDLIQLFRK